MKLDVEELKKKHADVIGQGEQFRAQSEQLRNAHQQAIGAAAAYADIISQMEAPEPEQEDPNAGESKDGLTETEEESLEDDVS